MPADPDRGTIAFKQAPSRWGATTAGTTVSDASLPPAEHLPGYSALEFVGQGGFGTVYRAYQQRLARTVAVKILSVRTDAATVARFHRECELASRLSWHPNVITVLDVGTTGSGRPYVTTDYLERGSLMDRLTADGPLPPTDVLRIGVQVCGALATVHDAGIVHRDVKPQNILVSGIGLPVLADFGLARIAPASEVFAGTQAFTPSHAAPEVLDGRVAGTAADIYALGSTLYQLLAGQPPFAPRPGEGIVALLLRVMHDEVPEIERPDVPPGLLSVLRTALAKDPEDRFGHAAQFGRRLQQVQAALGVAVTELPYDASTGPAPVPAPPPVLPATMIRASRARREESEPVARQRRWPFGRAAAPAHDEPAPNDPAPPAPARDLASAPPSDAHSPTVLRPRPDRAPPEPVPAPGARTRRRAAVIAAVLVAALVAGTVVLVALWPGQRHTTALVAGPGCPEHSSASTEHADADSGPGWQPGTGGWYADGCSGDLLYTTTTKTGNAATFSWTFHPAGNGTCELDVYTPDVGQAGGLAMYRYVSDAGHDMVVGIDQSTVRGQWTKVTRISTAQTIVTLTLNARTSLASQTDTGPPNIPDYQVVASAARVEC